MPFQKGNIPHNKGIKGYKHTDEAKEKIGLANKGLKRSEEVRKRISEIAKGRTKEKNPMFGKHHSNKTKEILSKQKLGEKSRFWNGGKHIDGDGYMMIYKSEHPNANAHKYVYLHRLIMEEYLGRYLTKEEIIHHINGIVTDNRIENLQLFKNKAEHILTHNYLKGHHAQSNNN